MDTKFCKLLFDNRDEDVYREAGEIIKKGGLVAFPTETVYGLGGDALNERASEKIYAAKGRPSDNPLIVHIADIDSLAKISDDVPEDAYVLAKCFWPGPLTMVIKKNSVVPLATTGGLNTVAVRMPDNEVALSFIRNSSGFIAAPSANLSGRPSPTSAKHVFDDMNGRIDMILDGGSVGIGVESTIVDLTGDIPILLRPGYITVKMLQQALNKNVEIDPAIGGILEDGTKPKAPGMKYRHYAPKGDMTIIKGDQDEVIKKINLSISEDKASGFKTGVIATTETVDYYTADCVKCIGSRDDEDSIARNLFSILRELDDEGIDKIYSEEFDTPNMGMAIMNRLLKAAGHKIIEV